MMRALLLGAFATTALGACGKDVSAIACKNLGPNSDFAIINDPSSADHVIQTGNIEVNAAIQYIGDAPWVRDSVTQPATTNGCQFTDPTAAGTTTTSTVMGVYECSITDEGVACAGTANEEKSTRAYKLRHTLQHMVSKLDDAGRFEVYFQRVLRNPIASTASFTGGTLQWIAENACKIYVDVEFECTGADCVEVTTIVCASFAGITTGNLGSVSIECKVPSGFQISQTNGGASGALLVHDTTTSANVLLGGAAADVWPSASISGTEVTVNSATAVNGALGSTQVLVNNVNTAISAGLQQGERYAGELTLSAFVKQGTSSWTNLIQSLHTAKYNLTRATNFVKSFDMAVNVLFYSETSALAVKDPAANEAAFGFTTAAQSTPFLAKTQIEYGTITTHNHAYLSVVAKVATDVASPVSFSDLHVTKVAHTIQGGSTLDHQPVPLSPTTATERQAAVADSHSKFCYPSGSTTTFGPDNWPRTYMTCPNLMDGTGGVVAAVTAGDTLVLSLKWKLVGTAPSNGAGKAALLQDAADEVQSVEVSLTIQLGGGETTITTAGGSDGSADPTVTYIIIAVCIVAAGLILAVVVVAFMCMRNRSQEAIVSMSPQKCTVAAVYDISQPKKADAMDV